MLELDEGRCYCAGLLHCLGDLACCAACKSGGWPEGELDEHNVQQSLDEFGAAFGSALRTRWRLPLALRELIAAILPVGRRRVFAGDPGHEPGGAVVAAAGRAGAGESGQWQDRALAEDGLPELNRLRKG
jgi:hypothetical protein